MIPVHRLVHYLNELLTSLAILALTTRGVVQLNSSFVGKVFYCTYEIEMLNFLHKLEYVARGPATKTAIALGFFAHVERTRFLGMERAQTNPVPTYSA